MWCMYNEWCSPLGKRVLWTKMVMQGFWFRQCPASPASYCIYPCYKLSEDTSSLLNVCVTKSCLVPHMKYMAGSVVSPMVSQHTMGLQGPLCSSSSTAIRDSCWSGAYTQQALSSASLPPVSAIMTPPPASHVYKYPVFSLSVCCSFLSPCSP